MKAALAIGWDIGGAHLKAVKLNAVGEVVTVALIYCPLWRGLHELDVAIDNALRVLRINEAPTQHFVTMTAELVDIFSDRATGVKQIADFFSLKVSAKNDDIRFFAGEKGFAAHNQVQMLSQEIASMNWLASIQYLAQHLPNALFLDIGSTTTDITLIRAGEPIVLALTDAGRMQYDALVYTGVVRTPLMALAKKIPFAGHWVNLAAEHFATTADIYTLTEDLHEAANSAETADGADKSTEACAKRLARMVGHDRIDAPLSAWRNLAFAFKCAQLEQIKWAVLRHMSLFEDSSQLTIVGAGVGQFLACDLAKTLKLPYLAATQFIKVDSAIKDAHDSQKMAEVCFPAYALACLGMQC